jgi:hypothetical protein
VASRITPPVQGNNFPLPSWRATNYSPVPISDRRSACRAHSEGANNVGANPPAPRRNRRAPTLRFRRHRGLARERPSAHNDPIAGIGWHRKNAFGLIAITVLLVSCVRMGEPDDILLVTSGSVSVFATKQQSITPSLDNRLLLPSGKLVFRLQPERRAHGRRVGNGSKARPRYH